jgi:para-nitrobenzyl esterase
MKMIRWVSVLTIALQFLGVQRPGAQEQPPTMGHTERLIRALVPPRNPIPLSVTSPSFTNRGDIPLENTQYRGNVFPGLAWNAGPTGTLSYVLIMQGEDQGSGTSATSIHLTLFNIPPAVRQLAVGMTSAPQNASLGPNVHGLNQPYAGPHTHTLAKHAYHLQVLALDTWLQLEPTVSFEALVAAMTGHVLASGELIGLAGMDPAAAAPQRAVSP